MNPITTIREWAARRRLNATLRALNGSAGAVPAAPVLSGTFVTPETALGIAGVFSAINVISRDSAVLPRAVYRLTGGGGRVIETKGYLGDLNEVISVQSNEDMDAFRWTQTSMSHVIGRGNSYSEIVRKNGFVQTLELLHPAKTIPKRTPSGKLFYELDNKQVLAPENVLHFAGMGFDGIKGYSPITLMRQSIGLTMGAEQFAAAMYGNGAFAGGWLKLAKKLSEVGVNNLRRTFNQIHQGSQSAHQIGVLEEGMDFVANQISPEDAQMILTREFQVKDIARIFCIPPHKIGDYSESHLANVEEANLDYITMTLAGWVTMFEFQLNTKLLSREDRKTHVIAVDMSGLLRGNVAAQMQRIQTMRNTGAWSADDIRIDQGLNPIGKAKGGDKYLVQAQYVPLDQAGEHLLNKDPSQTPVNKQSPTDGNPNASPEPTDRDLDFPEWINRINQINGIDH